MKNTLTKDDVWGTFDENYNLLTRGLIVAQGFGGEPSKLKEWEEKLKVKSVCPIWKDKLPYKSVTVVCEEEQLSDVINWLSYVHGGDCISRELKLPNGKFALRSNYTCW